MKLSLSRCLGGSVSPWLTGCLVASHQDPKQHKECQGKRAAISPLYSLMVYTLYLCLESEDGVSDCLQVFGGDILLQDLVKVGVG